jgi:hypothetical protein
MRIYGDITQKSTTYVPRFDVETYSLCLLLLCSVGSTGAGEVGRGSSGVVTRGVAQQTIGIRATNPQIKGRLPVLISSLADWHFSMFVQTPGAPSRVVQGSPVNKQYI